MDSTGKLFPSGTGNEIISPANDSIRYTRRVMPDGDLYFIFNEGNKATEFTADFDKVGVAKNGMRQMAHSNR